MTRQLDPLASFDRAAPRWGWAVGLALAAIAAVGGVRPASAQPLRAPPPDLTVRLPVTALEAGDSGFLDLPESGGMSETPTAYRTAWATVTGGIGSALGGSLTVATLGLVAFVASDASLWSASSSDGPPAAVFLVAGAAGATVGTGVLIEMFAQDESDYQGIVPYPDLRPGDGWPAFVGALVSLPVGLASVWLIQEALPSDLETVTPYLAVPVAQGIGAAIAINLSR